MFINVISDSCASWVVKCDGVY